MVASALFPNSVIFANSPIDISSSTIVLINNSRRTAALIYSPPPATPNSLNSNIIDDLSVSFSIGSFID